MTFLTTFRSLKNDLHAKEILSSLLPASPRLLAKGIESPANK